MHLAATSVSGVQKPTELEIDKAAVLGASQNRGACGPTVGNI